MGDGNGLLEGKRIQFDNNFVTVVYYKNGAKETINHLEPPQPDPLRLLHFKLSSSKGVAVNLEDVRKFETEVKSIATKSSELELLS